MSYLSHVKQSNRLRRRKGSWKEASIDCLPRNATGVPILHSCASPASSGVSQVRSSAWLSCHPSKHGRSQDFFRGEHFFKKFQKILKNIKKISKIFKKINKPSIQFMRVWTKNAICRKFLRKFSQENCEKCIILAYFSKELTNHAFDFGPVRQKTQFIGNFETIFYKFLKKIAKKHYSIFFKEI